MRHYGNILVGVILGLCFTWNAIAEVNVWKTDTTKSKEYPTPTGYPFYLPGSEPVTYNGNKKSDSSYSKTLKLIDLSGNQQGARQGKTSEPKMIIDTVKMDSGWYVGVLNSSFLRTQLKTAPTTKFAFLASVTQVLSDTSDTVRSYGYYISTNCETLIVKSNSISDTGLVAIMAIIK